MKGFFLFFMLSNNEPNCQCVQYTTLCNGTPETFCALEENLPDCPEKPSADGNYNFYANTKNRLGVLSLKKKRW